MLFTNWGLPGSKYLSLFFAYIVYLRNPSLLGYIYILSLFNNTYKFSNLAHALFSIETHDVYNSWDVADDSSNVIISGLCLKKSVGLVYKALLISLNISRKQPTLTTFDCRWVPQTGLLTSYIDPSRNSSICRSDNCNGWDNHFPLVMSKPIWSLFWKQTSNHHSILRLQLSDIVRQKQRIGEAPRFINGNWSMV
jgi:hypothetical protein